MQLLVLLLALILGDKGGNMAELKPVLESLGGESLGNTLKQAEQLSGMLTAVQSLAGAQKREAVKVDKSEFNGGSAADGYPLAPIANIADENITYCLSRYIAVGE